MKKFLVIVAGILLFTSPAMALFTNGGFEDGNFNGWNLDFGEVQYGTSTITWGEANHGRYAVIDSTGTIPGQTLDVNPYNGTYMARINDSAGGYHATKIYQSDTISQTDIDNASSIFVNWGAMLVEPTNRPHTGTQPFFGIEVSIGGSVVETFTADATAHSVPGSGWVPAGTNPPGLDSGILYYKQDTWSFDISNYKADDEIIISMFAADCGLSGHGGYAFLDGVGTTYDPPNEVPEPATLLLLGFGLFGIAGFGRKRILKKT